MGVVVALIAGGILALAFPGANLWWLAWFAAAPLIYYACVQKPRAAFFSGLAFGFGYFGTLLYWIGVFGGLPWFALAVFQSLFVAAFAVAVRKLGAGLRPAGLMLLAPALWVSFEWLRSLGMMGFTWGDLGYSQSRFLPAAQAAEFGGVWAVSFLVALVNSALAIAVATRRGKLGERTSSWSGVRLPVIAVLVVTIVVVGVGWARLAGKHASGRSIRVAVAQGNIDQDTTEDYEFVRDTWGAYTPMTHEAGLRGAELIVWPETVVPGLLGREPFQQARLTEIASDARADLLVGGWDGNDRGGTYNSAFVIRPGGGVIARYSKVHLVPFGEFVPLRRFLPFLQRYKVTPHDTLRGPGYSVLDGGRYRVGAVICFESIFPDASRTLTLGGADLLCVMTNDCWYDETAAAEQHMAMSVFRAIENRRTVVRAASTGISCLIDSYGRVTGSIGVRRAGVLYGDAALGGETTMYTRLGDWVVWLSISLSAVLALLALRARRMARTHASAEEAA